MLHILIAISSLVFAVYTLARPAKSSLAASYGSIFATIASGMYLVAAEPAKMLHMCIAGLFYLAISITLTTIARVRLAKLKETAGGA